MSIRRVTLVGAVDSARLRTARFNGEDYVVVPVIALMEGVIHASNAPNPEFVPIEVLEVAPAGWNGRPVVPTHPMAGGESISANSPEILESQSFGMLFGAHISKRRLCVEAWLSESKASRVGEDALDVIRQCRAGKPVEVSVGAFVIAEQRSGEYNGKRYMARWTEITPDHLAMGLAGAPGACSVAMGCGAPRAAAAQNQPDTRRYRVDGDEIEEEMMATEPNAQQQRTLRERLLSLMRFRSSAGTEADMSDADIRNAIDSALRASEPGYLGIDSVFPADALVVYAVAPESAVILYQRGYGVSDGAITLAADKTEVRPVTRYEAATQVQSTTATATATTAQARAQSTGAGATNPPAACGCQGGNNPATATNAGGGDMAVAKTKKERIQALIACPKTPYADADLAVLEGMSEDRLTAIEEFHSKLPDPTAQPAATTTQTQAQPATTTPQPTVATASAPLTEEEYLKTAPESIRDIVVSHKAAQATRKAALVATLKGAVDGAYTETELSAMPVDQLEKLSKVAAKASLQSAMPVAGRAMPRGASAGDGVEAAPGVASFLKK